MERLRAIAATVGASVAQVAIAWVAAQGDDIIPLVGSRTRAQLTEALGSRSVTLTVEHLAALTRAIPQDAAAGGRYPAAALEHLDSEK